MEEKPEAIEEATETLDGEVGKFANNLPYWSKYLAEKILTGKTVSEIDVDNAYLYLLEYLKLSKEKERVEIAIKHGTDGVGTHSSTLLLKKVDSVEGVNALSENQTLEFSPNLTIVYGANGSGKSGYIRLLKKAFYAKAPEDILPNVHNENDHKPVKAQFYFQDAGNEISKEYPSMEASAEFQQFAVFDGKCALSHLSNKNEFEFRPAGLGFFANYTSAILEVEQRLFDEIAKRKNENEFTHWFEGESEIKTLVEKLDAKTKIEDLTKYCPFTDEDKSKKEKLQKSYDETSLALKGREKEIKALENIKKLLNENKASVENLNSFFNKEYLKKIDDAIANCIMKEEKAQAEGIQNFNTDKIENIGSEEWKNFILAAEAFANNQREDGISYPENGDNCLLCHQPLTPEAQSLITNYWVFIKSLAEEEATKAREVLEGMEKLIGNLKFDLFPEENSLTVWLSENQPKALQTLRKQLRDQEKFAQVVILQIQQKKPGLLKQKEVGTNLHQGIEASIDEKLKMLRDDENNEGLKKLQVEKIFLEHKEKFNLHFEKFDAYVANQVWIEKANSANFAKRQITDTEKTLSQKYFNQKYVDAFNEECEKLRGNFGIDINHTGSAGKSYRQLKLRGRNPNAVLSEGEQKVIALADFITEMQLSDINRGIIFDDPVTSLDHSRKEDIANRLVQESITKQVVVFTHDVVFFKYLEKAGLAKYGKDDSKLYYHTISSNGGNSIGVIELNHSPVRESNYTNSNIPQKYLKKAINEPDKDFSTSLIRSGFGALRTCYEAITATKILGSTVQRYDALIRVSNIKRIKYNMPLYEKISDRHSFLHNLIEGHLPIEEMNLSFTTERLIEEIKHFDEVNDEIGKI